MHFLVRKWWALALRGLAAIIFGVLTFLMPGITLVVLVMLFGAYALVDGILSVIASFRGVAHHWALLIEGVIGIFAGHVFMAGHYYVRAAVCDRLLGDSHRNTGDRRGRAVAAGDHE